MSFKFKFALIDFEQISLLQLAIIQMGELDIAIQKLDTKMNRSIRKAVVELDKRHIDISLTTKESISY